MLIGADALEAWLSSCGARERSGEQPSSQTWQHQSERHRVPQREMKSQDCLHVYIYIRIVQRLPEMRVYVYM